MKLLAKLYIQVLIAMALAMNVAMSGGTFSLEHFFLSIIPKTQASALVEGDIPPVLFVSVLVGLALARCAKPDWIGPFHRLYVDVCRLRTKRVCRWLCDLPDLDACGIRLAA